MTREEEKLKAADEYVKSRIKQGQGMTGDVFPAFIEGIEWADANPDRNTFACISLISAEQAKKRIIDRTCKWWEDELTYPSMTPEEIKWYKNKINAFRKAMKK